MLRGMRLAWFLGCALLIAGCGSRSRLAAADGGGSGGGAGGSGGAGAVSGAGGFGGAPLGGAGGVSGCGPVDTGAPCSTLGEVGCLTAFPRCAPVYDDQCCPMCQPTGMCADCMSWQFYECIDRELSNCVPGAIGHCGQTPQWACNGGRAECPESACQFVPGCVEALPSDCPEDAFCPPECHPVTKEICGPTCGPPVPMPMCPNGGAHEVQGGQYTGYCIEASVCGGPNPPPPVGPCPPSLPSGQCGSPGQICTYGSWCASTCTCDGSGFWSCVTPPC
ncbi:MAG: hypothetical protein DYH12_06105 [Sorangiineae bacterium PRO1]|nr:hypothetical protein [Sorangiineae bacterium PRO1]